MSLHWVGADANKPIQYDESESNCSVNPVIAI